MGIRRIAVFHNTAQVGSAWCCAEGIITTLSKKGYEVFNCGHPLHNFVPIETLQTMDMIVMGAPEWFDEVLNARYGRFWAQLDAVKVAWYAESANRDDRSFDFTRCHALADLHYFPASQDADEFGGQWLPFGADTSLFHPMPVEKCYETAFLGSLYQKRLDYIREVGFPISIIPPIHSDNPVQSFHLLAKAYNSTSIFVNMPAYSRLLVTKVTEVMACGTMLVTPAIDHPSGSKNMKQFEDGKHLVYYDQNKSGDLLNILEYFRNHPAERDAIAAAGHEEITRRHTLEHRIDKILADAEVLVGRVRKSETMQFA
jgi:spore maturation protein CgeB